jgi:hypothetical protein
MEYRKDEKVGGFFMFAEMLVDQLLARYFL